VRASKQPPPRAETLRKKEKKGIAAGDLGEAGSKLSKSQLWALRRREGGGGEKFFLFGFWLALTISFSSPSPLRPPRHRRVLIALSPKMARSLLFVAMIAALTCAASAAPGE